MRCIVYLFLIEFIGLIESSKPRSVNVALETVLEFDGKDDVDFIDTLQNFLGKLKTTITRTSDDNPQENKPLHDVKEEDDKQFVFADFVADTVSVLKTYEDDDLKTFFRTLDKELKKWETRKEFYDIKKNLGLRRIMDGKLENMKRYPIDKIRRKLNYLSENFNHNKRNDHKGFVSDVLNNFYKRESKTKLMNVLNNLRLYRSNRRGNLLDLKQIIRSGIRTIIDPFLKLNPESFPDINGFYDKYIANYSDPVLIEKYLFKDNIKNDSKPLTRQRHKHQKDVTENELLDYIEDHNRVIKGRITTKRAASTAKLKSKDKIFKTTNTVFKHISATRRKKNRKRKTKHNSRVRAITNLYDLMTTTTEKIATHNSSDDKKLVLINLGSDESEKLVSEEDYVSSTSKQPTKQPSKQKRYKKSTRRKITTDNTNISKTTTKKSRKAFRNKTFSAEGLSIEHFGSLFGREYHKDINDNTTFVEIATNTTPLDITLLKNESITFKNKTRRKGDMSLEIGEYDIEKHDDIKNVSDNIDEITTTVTNSFRTDNILLKKPIEIRANFVIEKATNRVLETTETDPISDYETAKVRNYNVSIATKQVNFKAMEPELYRRQDTVTSIKITTPTVTSSVPAEAKNLSVTNSNKDTINTKPMDDLENEIENIIDKYNATTIPVEYERMLNKVESNDKENDKVKEQLKADFAKLMAPPTTKSTVTELFTDPFGGIDNVDIY